MINDSETRLIRKEEMHLETKHNKGGQSSARFGRAHDNKRHRHHMMIADCLLEEYYDSSINEMKVKGLIIGGPAESKDQVIRTEVFQKYLNDSLIYSAGTDGVFHEGTVEKLYEQAKESLNRHHLDQEKAIFEELMILKETNLDIMVFGPKEVMQGLEDCMLKKVVYATDSEFSQRIQELGEAYGCELVELSSRTCQDEIMQYGGLIGIRWY